MSRVIWSHDKGWCEDEGITAHVCLPCAAVSRLMFVTDGETYCRKGHYQNGRR